MGIASWARRIFGRPDDSVPCNLCRCAIPRGDIDKGLAVVIARQQYCKHCVEEITFKNRNNSGWTLTDLGSSSTVLMR